MVQVKKWLGVEKLRLELKDWFILATPLLIFFSYHPVIHLGQGEFKTNYEFSLLQIHLIILVLLHLPTIWKNRQTLIKNRAVQLAFIFVSYSSLTVFWTPNLARGLLTAGVMWLLFGVLLSVMANEKLARLKNALVRVWLASAVLVCLFALYQFIAGLTPITETTLLCAGCMADQFGFVRPNAFAIEPQFLGNLLLAPTLLLIHILLTRKHTKVMYVILGLLIMTIFLTLSRGAILALAVGILVLLVINRKYAKKFTSVIFVSLASFVLSLFAQGLAVQMNPNVSETFSDGFAKSLNQLSMGVIDIRDKTPTQSEESAPAKFDGYIERSTDERLTGSCLALNTWSASPEKVIFGVGLGGAGYYFEKPESRNGLWCKTNL